MILQNLQKNDFAIKTNQFISRRENSDTFLRQKEKKKENLFAESRLFCFSRKHFAFEQINLFNQIFAFYKINFTVDIE